MTKRLALSIIGVGFLVIFAVVWIQLAWKLHHFVPSADHKTLDVDNDRAKLAGFLASSLGASTATALGIAIQKPEFKTFSFGARLRAALTSSWFAWLGILVYVLVGLFVLLIWQAHTAEAPDVIRTFGWGIVGWLAGAAAAAIATG